MLILPASDDRFLPWLNLVEEEEEVVVARLGMLCSQLD